LPSITGSAAARPDVAEAEHGGAVGDHRDQPAGPGVAGGQRRVGGDRLADPSHSGRVRQRQVGRVAHRRGAADGELATLVQGEDRIGQQIDGAHGGSSGLVRSEVRG
jgi:hypothetical protein